MPDTSSARRLLLLALLLPGVAAAQPPAPGDRIRITHSGPGENPLVGHLLNHSADSLWLATNSDSRLGVSLGSVRRLERSLGRASHLKTGALIGAGVGTATTVGFLTLFCGGDNRCDGDEQVRAVAVFGLPALALGAGIGALIKTEKWVVVSPPQGRAGFGLGARLRF